MKYIKTYGVAGLVEWNTILTSGKVKMRVVFSGGALTAYGVTPATFTTKNPMVQSIIENSTDYKSGRILLLNAIAAESAESAGLEGRATVTEADTDNDTDNDTEAEGAVDELKAIPVSSWEAAKDYLNEHFGIGRTKMQSHTAIERLAAENGIKLVFGE